MYVTTTAHIIIVCFMYVHQTVRVFMFHVHNPKQLIYSFCILMYVLTTFHIIMYYLCMEHQKFNVFIFIYLRHETADKNANYLKENTHTPEFPSD